MAKPAPSKQKSQPVKEAGGKSVAGKDPVEKTKNVVKAKPETTPPPVAGAPVVKKDAKPNRPMRPNKHSQPKRQPSRKPPSGSLERAGRC